MINNPTACWYARGSIVGSATARSFAARSFGGRRFRVDIVCILVTHDQAGLVRTEREEGRGKRRCSWSVKATNCQVDICCALSVFGPHRRGRRSSYARQQT